MTPNDHTGLPYHWLRLKLSGNLFLDRIEKIVRTDITIKPKRAKQAWLDRLFIPVPDSPHYKKLQIDVSLETKQRRLVRVDARGDWMKGPSPEFYDEVVTKYFIPYLDAYNRKHKSALQLEKGKLYTGRPSLPPEANALLELFIDLSCHKYKLPNWESLYPFILHCHARKIKLSTSDFIHFLRNAGFAEESAKQIAKIYAHGRNILSFYKRRRDFFAIYFD